MKLYQVIGHDHTGTWTRETFTTIPEAQERARRCQREYDIEPWAKDNRAYFTADEVEGEWGMPIPEDAPRKTIYDTREMPTRKSAAA